VYVFADSVRPSGADAGQHALEAASQSLQQYSDLYGTYPHPRMIVVQGDFQDGMEASGLVFVSTNWFYTFEGGAANYLTVITVHEVAHQWWYARVGNDSALAPWLDEALSTYSEYVYIEEYYPDLKNWWWDFRVAGYDPDGSVDSTVYEFDSGRAYINAIYLRGVQMLHNLRTDVGTEAFFKLLAEYGRVADGRIATPQLFWSLFTPEQLALTQGTRDQFLRQPDVFAGNR
jgi:aminopeptidase N